MSDNAKSIDKAIKLLRTFQTIDKDMSVTCALAVLLASKHTRQKDLEQMLGLSNAAASRNVAYWSKRYKPNQAGKDYIGSSLDPMDHRLRLIDIRPQGHVLFDTINKILEE
ncbi:hypothetical protein N9J60_06660 [Alphaproteobacteria bacterium]|nr:hypothetical protein [Alphaproteobacteria bacterium]